MPGFTSDPKVSVPKASGASPALVAIVLPEEDPDGLYTTISGCDEAQQMLAYTMSDDTVAHIQAAIDVRRLRLAMHCGPATPNARASTRIASQFSNIGWLIVLT